MQLTLPVHPLDIQAPLTHPTSHSTQMEHLDQVLSYSLPHSHTSINHSNTTIPSIVQPQHTTLGTTKSEMRKLQSSRSSSVRWDDL
ncbi:hypothetical protein VNO80_22832 [Phaseolus coccineus]|uniref:Uncharacterized protein n=1 Tax=Phaseolus coccineus TaxID=3886 RepID=A0AAN9M6H8_PHACN